MLEISPELRGEDEVEDMKTVNAEWHASLSEIQNTVDQRRSDIEMIAAEVFQGTLKLNLRWRFSYLTILRGKSSRRSRYGSRGTARAHCRPQGKDADARGHRRLPTFHCPSCLFGA